MAVRGKVVSGRRFSVAGSIPGYPERVTADAVRSGRAKEDR
ncbi:hypothetical protein SAMN05421833_11678 [Microbispora rosea]|uniref:Uncharacterized protein n=1 Tax=Microbispora rosea TaxID=58117 RepID=A0A1N7E1E8_9ACTN|nr:hypothetical protein SAMN05421833_11678 [Microbispora rosea]